MVTRFANRPDKIAVGAAIVAQDGKGVPQALHNGR
jgi:hypothetical protein